MSITPDGFLDWAQRDPGPAEKQYSAPNSVEGYVPHSAVGYYNGWLSRLKDMSRMPDGRFTPNAAASVHGWVAYSGTVTQHYPFTASCWASGNAYANTHLVAFENEGGYNPVNEVLTEGQIAANVRIIQELAAWKGWTPKRGLNLLEHNECVTRWGGSATSCPNNRIPWDEIMRRLSADNTEEDNMQIIGQYATRVPHQVSWLVFADAAGNIKKNAVDDAAQHDALVAAGFPVKALPGVDKIPTA